MAPPMYMEKALTSLGVKLTIFPVICTSVRSTLVILVLHTNDHLLLW